MSDILLYHCPRACSQVVVCALEEAGLPYELRLINILAGEQLTEAYKAVSPLGKVPAAVIDGNPLTENSAILMYIARTAPASAVLPGIDADPWVQAEAQWGLSFCGGTLHPQVRGLMAPQRLTTGDELAAIREKAAELAKQSFSFANQRITDRGWWLGSWSIVDVYLNWAFSAALRAGFDGAPFTALLNLSARLAKEKASFRRMAEIDARSLKELGL